MMHKQTIEDFIKYYNEERIKEKLGYLSPEVVTMIENSSREQLEKLAVEIVSIKDENDILALLMS